MSLWSLIKEKIIAWLSDDVKKPKPVVTKTPASYDPGLNCPQCKFKMRLSMGALLGGKPIVCPACGLSLTVDRERSKGCLNELKKVNDAIQKVEEAKRLR
ncbi:MAG: hypothetical protein OEW48_12640 [Phycisphaerae bacterium]|nr:hypothetical protein [Phycisphaerae bacterium]